MPRKSIIQIVEKVKSLLEKEKELSTRQISLKLHSQWRTVDKALEMLVALGIAKKRRNNQTERVETLYSLKE